MKFESFSVKLLTSLAVLPPQLLNERPLITTLSTELIVILLELMQVIVQLEALSYTDIEKQFLAVIENSFLSV